MQLHETKAEDQAWLNESVLVYNRSTDKPFRFTYAKKNKEIPPQSVAPVPRAAIMIFLGNPRLRKDPVLWFREISRLKSAIGDGTTHFNYWLVGEEGLGSRIACPDFGNHLPGYFGIPGQGNDVYEKIGTPIPKEYLQMKELPSVPMVQTFDPEQFDAMVRAQVGGNRPKEAVGEGFGGDTSVDDDLAASIESARVTATDTIGRDNQSRLGQSSWGNEREVAVRA